MDSDIKKPSVTCNICGKSFSKSAYHNKHLKNVHNTNVKGEKLPDDRVTCVLCDKSFKEKRSLQHHMNAVHFLNPSSTFECDQCSYKTSYKSNLKKHVKKHDLKKESSRRQLQCLHCSASFTYEKHLRYHERKTHNIGSSSKAKVRRKCPICTFVSSTKSRLEINSHFKEVHNITLRWESYSFENLRHFQEWKKDVEKSTTTCYNERKKLKQYVCHRSGNYNKAGKNIRHLKIMGSCKINAFCPSEIKINVNKNGSVDVMYLPCHVGHKNQLKYIRLTHEEKTNIAAKLLNRTPHEYILQDIRTSLRNCDLHRIHLANKKDISNIEKSFNLNNETQKHPFDPISIKAWVQDLNSDKNTSALHYKPQGVTSPDFPHLQENDFLLIFMTKAQETLLKEYGSDIVCIDSTHGLNKYNFQLYTLLVMDESREGFPVAFMFTNKSDESVVNIFLQKIKERCGQIKPNVFMSDMEEALYSAWSNVMGPASLRLFCTWHVLKAWRGNLNKIRNKEKKEEVYKMLKTLLYELETETFQKMLHTVEEKMKNDVDTSEYYKYFQEHYIKTRRYENWAYCYRVNCGINTNMSLENFNKVLKYCYLRGKKIKRLDKTLCAILNLLRDKLFDLLIKMKKGKIVSKLRSLRQRHKNSFLIPENNIIMTDEYTWQVLSTTGLEFYTVKKIKECSRCQLQCLHCETCFHEYICSCIDHAIKSNMCKHIHAIGKIVRDKIQQMDHMQVSEDGGNPLIIDNVVHNLEEDIVGEVCVKPTDGETQDTLDITHRFTKKMNSFVEYVHKNTKSIAQMHFVEKATDQIISTLNAMASTSQPVVQDSPLVSPNINIEKQRRFFSTKKCSKPSSSRQTFSDIERNKIALELLHPMGKEK